MFDSVLQTQNLPRGRFGVGFAVRVLIHVGVRGLAVWSSTRKHRPVVSDVPVTFVRTPMAAPPPPPPPPARHHKTTKVTPTKPKPVQIAQIIQPKEVPQENPPQPPPHDPPNPEPDAPQAA